MKLVMPDTNVLIDIWQNQSKAQEKLHDFQGYTFAISHLVYMEFLAGTQAARKSSARKFLSTFIVKPYNEQAHKASEIFAYKYFIGRGGKPWI